ncbi:arylsulfatase [Flavilitoribacter nigricans]|uniref:Cerebroside-sulfatase n=1 Tax=Flavilitoribacter nigricans (strain ATCC 23147 / DSM 23189 / NBRC 102662 / NCIMB 1420 / SS-2) TaxID=1122177 RepID=A0A2D0NHT2_FLAN2|nr:arylsulfatase [Flavilitoribacter nigricans]PHN07936.1 Cerebroside-sulfatase [Flavilitoribacter nigricans DSM 23189 = NBRC 102662]
MKNTSILTLTLFLFTVVLFSRCSQENDPVDSAKPNVIFIMADDLGYGDVGVYGQERIQTPRLDQMAEQGLKFTQFYAGTSVCAPSRSSLITGLTTGHTEIRGNLQNGRRNGQQPLSAGTYTIAKLMKEAGYTTGMIGKWGLGNPNTSGNPLRHGWDFFYGYTDQVLAHNYYPEYLWKNNEKVFLDNEVNYLDTSAWHGGLGSYSTQKREYSGDLLFEEAEAFIQRNQDTPFFLYLPITAPHDNGEQPDSMRFEVPDQGIYEDRPWPKTHKDYAAMITRMDSCIGALLDQLDRLGLAENTLILFTSDNGPFNNHPTTDFFDSNGPLRGAKRDLYEGGMREPMIARWTGKIEPNTTSDHLGAFWDLMPTLAELVGVAPPENTDGISFVPTLLGETEQKEHAHLYWEFHEGTGSQAIRQGKWKAVRTDAITHPEGGLELYDLSTDLGESQNLADEYPEKVRELDSLMTASRTHSDLFPFGRDD